MKSNGSGNLGLALLAVAGGLILMEDPKCKCGCRTLAQHLLVTGVRLLTGQSWA